jgi:hypothetical protein
MSDAIAIGQAGSDSKRDRPIAFYSKLILKKYTQRTGNPQVIGPTLSPISRNFRKFPVWVGHPQAKMELASSQFTHKSAIGSPIYSLWHWV